MVNLARFIPGTPDADYMRQQVSERGILEKIDAVNAVIKRGLGEEYSVVDFYKMIADIENNLNRNMNDPRAKNLVNTFTEEPKAEVKKETPKASVVDKKDIPDDNDKQPIITDNEQGAGGDRGPAGPEGPGEGTGIFENPDNDGAQGPEGTSEGTGIVENPDTDGNSAGTNDNAEVEQTTKRGRKKAEDAE